MDKLRGRIVEERLNISKLAAALGINPITLSRKMNGDSEFTREEISNISTILGLEEREILDIFFCG